MSKEISTAKMIQNYIDACISNRSTYANDPKAMRANESMIEDFQKLLDMETA
jgi:hypothetical protein